MYSATVCLHVSLRSRLHVCERVCVHACVCLSSICAHCVCLSHACVSVQLMCCCELGKIRAVFGENGKVVGKKNYRFYIVSPPQHRLSEVEWAEASTHASHCTFCMKRSARQPLSLKLVTRAPAS